MIVRGALAIVFGLLIIALPSATAFVVMVMFAFFAIVDGITSLAHYFYDPAGRSRWTLVGGFVSIAAGIVAVAWPGVTAAVVGVLIGLWALVLGLSQIVLSLAARNFVRSWGIWFLTGLIATVFGIVVLVNPGIGFLTLVWMVAGFAMLMGLLLIVSGVGLRRLASASEMYAR